MKKVKIGIISFYYKNDNYGGMLQAYALCRFLNSENFKAEQITFDNSINENGNIMIEPLTERFHKAKISDKVKMLINYTKSHLTEKLQKLHDPKIMDDMNIRKKAFERFTQDYIPHSKKIYNELNIDECSELYDAYITGSDQVWNPIYYHSAYYLSFVPNTKTKISYAPSVSQHYLTPKQKGIISEHLKCFDAISVREKESIGMISDIVDINVNWAIDPTMLLSTDEWDKIISDRIVSEDYIFCYFLGDDKNSRSIVEKFAKNKNLKIVTLPYLHGHYRKCDESFGDERLFDISPQEFLSLIKYASYIFTDSYHSAVFSCLYQKEFFVFPRNKIKGMGTRITSLAKLFEFDTHFISTPESKNIKYIENLSRLDYSKNIALFNKLKQDSVNYLIKNISGE